MTSLATCSLILLLPVASRAEDPATLISRASAAYKTEDYARAATLYQDAIKAGAQPGVPAYNAACCFALLGKTDEAFTWLAKSLDAGWRDVEKLRADADFKSLHADPRWEVALERCKKAQDAFAKTIKEPALRLELLERMKEDQRIRLDPNPDLREWTKIDADNTAFMKKVIDKHG